MVFDRKKNNHFFAPGEDRTHDLQISVWTYSRSHMRLTRYRLRHRSRFWSELQLKMDIVYPNKFGPHHLTLLWLGITALELVPRHDVNCLGGEHVNRNPDDVSLFNYSDKTHPFWRVKLTHPADAWTINRRRLSICADNNPHRKARPLCTGIFALSSTFHPLSPPRLENVEIQWVVVSTDVRM